ncbi:MAG: MFS transporter [Treponema sp.]|jgi:MFS family permease|nr:MFS transporter [Treponema sp.]
MKNLNNPQGSAVKKAAFSFILLMGVVSLFSDMTHEGARSIMGAYLGLAGASAAAIGFVSGLGEFVGYSLRLLTGFIADRTRRYWTLTIVGYLVDVLAIPALALVPRNGWIFACILIVIQRTGKAIKKPAKDTILSFAAAQNGAGKSFAIQELLDQIGAFLGPVILFLCLLVRKGGDEFSAYVLAFAVLGIPAAVTMILLLFARRKYPHPEQFEEEQKTAASEFRLNKTFVFYIAAISLFAMGFLDFPLITMHAARGGLFSTETLPLLYSSAMIVDALAALVFGFLYDKFSLKVLMLSTAFSVPFAFFIFLFNARWALFLGTALWGIGMGAQESILKAAVTSIVPKQSRAKGFGIFQTFFGLFWFLGSWCMGALYDFNITAMVIFSAATQLAAIPLYFAASRSLALTRQ